MDIWLERKIKTDFLDQSFLQDFEEMIKSEGLHADQLEPSLSSSMKIEVESQSQQQVLPENHNQHIQLSFPESTKAVKSCTDSSPERQSLSMLVSVKQNDKTSQNPCHNIKHSKDMCKEIGKPMAKKVRHANSRQITSSQKLVQLPSLPSKPKQVKKCVQNTASKQLIAAAVQSKLAQRSLVQNQASTIPKNAAICTQSILGMANILTHTQQIPVCSALPSKQSKSIYIKPMPTASKGDISRAKKIISTAASKTKHSVLHGGCSSASQISCKRNVIIQSSDCNSPKKVPYNEYKIISTNRCVALNTYSKTNTSRSKANKKLCVKNNDSIQILNKSLLNHVVPLASSIILPSNNNIVHQNTITQNLNSLSDSQNGTTYHILENPSNTTCVVLDGNKTAFQNFNFSTLDNANDHIIYPVPGTQSIISCPPLCTRPKNAKSSVVVNNNKTALQNKNLSTCAKIQTPKLPSGYIVKHLKPVNKNAIQIETNKKLISNQESYLPSPALLSNQDRNTNNLDKNSGLIVPDRDLVKVNEQIVIQNTDISSEIINVETNPREIKPMFTPELQNTVHSSSADKKLDSNSVDALVKNNCKSNNKILTTSVMPNILKKNLTSSKSLQCPMCTNSFISQTVLAKHKHVIHGIDLPADFKYWPAIKSAITCKMPSINTEHKSINKTGKKSCKTPPNKIPSTEFKQVMNVENGVSKISVPISVDSSNINMETKHTIKNCTDNFDLQNSAGRGKFTSKIDEPSSIIISNDCENKFKVESNNNTSGEVMSVNSAVVKIEKELSDDNIVQKQHENMNDSENIQANTAAVRTKGEITVSETIHDNTSELYKYDNLILNTTVKTEYTMLSETNHDNIIVPHNKYDITQNGNIVTNIIENCAVIKNEFKNSIECKIVQNDTVIKKKTGEKRKSREQDRNAKKIGACEFSVKHSVQFLASNGRIMHKCNYCANSYTDLFILNRHLSSFHKIHENAAFVNYALTGWNF